MASRRLRPPRRRPVVPRDGRVVGGHAMASRVSEMSEKPFGPYGDPKWGGDNSVPQGTLVPCFGDFTDKESPWSNWDYCDGREHVGHGGHVFKMPDLRGWSPNPFATYTPDCWLMCLNGQTTVRGERIQLT